MPLALRIAWALLGLLALLAVLHPATGSAADPRPNVVVLMTDDQTVADLEAMPRTRMLLGATGVSFDRSYVSYPVCCPSRATYLSGQYAHNHRVLGLYPPPAGTAASTRARRCPSGSSARATTPRTWAST
jgi:N-acetylglucosamine-6-sulfatase